MCFHAAIRSIILETSFSLNRYLFIIYYLQRNSTRSSRIYCVKCLQLSLWIQIYFTKRYFIYIAKLSLPFSGKESNRDRRKQTFDGERSNSKRKRISNRITRMNIEIDNSYISSTSSYIYMLYFSKSINNMKYFIDRFQFFYMITRSLIRK